MNNNYFALRHGQNAYQEDKKDLVYPWPDGEPVFLSSEGERQIKEALERIKKEKIDIIYASDITRAKQTAEIVAGAIGVDIILDPRLRDINFGIYHGKTQEEFYSFVTNQEERFTKAPEKGESWNDIRERLIDFLKDIEKKYKNKNILLVSHGDPIWLLMGMALGIDDKELLRLRDYNKKGYLNPCTGEFRKIEFKNEL